MTFNCIAKFNKNIYYITGTTKEILDFLENKDVTIKVSNGRDSLFFRTLFFQINCFSCTNSNIKLPSSYLNKTDFENLLKIFGCDLKFSFVFPIQVVFFDKERIKVETINSDEIDWGTTIDNLIRIAPERLTICNVDESYYDNRIIKEIIDNNNYKHVFDTEINVEYLYSDYDPNITKCRKILLEICS